MSIVHTLLPLKKLSANVYSGIVNSRALKSASSSPVTQEHIVSI